MRSRSITTFLKLICFSPNKRYFNGEKQHEERKQLNTFTQFFSNASLLSLHSCTEIKCSLQEEICLKFAKSVESR